jgi:hypothetical protein
MRVLEKGIMANGTKIQIEEWNETYSFMPYGDTIAVFALSQTSHDGSYSPKRNEIYRFDFRFNNNNETKQAFNELLLGTRQLIDFKENLRDKEYADCII